VQLAPDIQEAILFLSEAETDQKKPLERELRPIAAMHDWSEQRNLWSQIYNYSTELESSLQSVN